MNASVAFLITDWEGHCGRIFEWNAQNVVEGDVWLNVDDELSDGPFFFE